MGTLNHFTKAGLDNLPSLPSQSCPISSGLYAVKHSLEDHADAGDDKIASKIWFKSPVSSATTCHGSRLADLAYAATEIGNNPQDPWNQVVRRLS